MLGLKNDLAVNQRIAHPALHSIPVNGVFLPWLFNAAGFDLPVCFGVKDTHVGRCADRLDALHPDPISAPVAMWPWQAHRTTARLSCCAHFSTSGSNSSMPVAPASASANGNCLASSSTGAWSEQIASIVPSSNPARSAARSRRLRSGGTKAAIRLEKADVHF